MVPSRLRPALLLLLLGVALPLRAEVKLASPFTDHMVLQREMKVPVWGTADPGEKITVKFAGQAKSATATADGKWRVNLAPLDTSATGRTFTVTGTKTAQPIALSDVLVGEVWLASGQSNMDFSISKSVKSFAGLTNEAEEIAAANYPNIRILTGTATRIYEPQATVGGDWKICTPENAPAFSAISYFFARDLQKEIKVPVGIITMSFGASTAESWIQREALASDPLLNPMLVKFDADVQKFRSTPHTAVATPPSEDVSAGSPTPASTPSPTAAASPAASPMDSASPAGSPGVSPSPAARRARRPGDPNPEHNQHNPTVLFNGMINPIVPYAIRGAIWYQGESILNGAAGHALYPHVQATLIKNWRSLWGEGNFPFYIVQLAALQNASNSPEVREAQATVLQLPKTGMAVTTDIGDPKNVHPKDKQDVGDRLTRIALANVYGKKIEFSGPMFSGAKVENGAIRLSFTHADGLMAKGGTLKGFTIAGADGTFVPADASIEGNTVVVSGENLSNPVSVRYGWENYPAEANLYNSAGLPAAPFRTDAPKLQL